MRQILRLLGTRYGAALILLLAIGLVVAVGKAVGGTQNTSGLIEDIGTPPASTASPQDDDGLISPEAPSSPSTSPGAAQPQAVATGFVTAWLHHTGVTPAAWYAELARYMTKKLAGELRGVDPATVPATRITGPPAVIDHGVAFVEVSIALDGGVITLRMLATSGRWLVDGVDWAPG